MSAVIDAHGGLERWSKVESIEVILNFSGSVLKRKGYPHRYQPVCTIDARKPKVVLQGLGHGSRDDRWIYTPNRVWIERRDGTVTASRDNPHDAFADHSIETPWDDLHQTFFVGYAMHNYLTFPFHLVWPGFDSKEVEAHQENGETWRVLQVGFPDSYPTHSKIQWFYFDDQFMLRRLDYAPNATKRPGAHYCYDAETVDGLVIPTFRRVVGREADLDKSTGGFNMGGLTRLSGPSAFRLDYCRVIVRDEGA